MMAARTRRRGHTRLAGMREAATTARRGAALVIVAAPAAVAGYLALAFLSGVLPVVQVWLTKLVVDALTTRTGYAPPAAPALALAALYALTFVVRTVVDPLEGMLIPSLQSRTAAEIDRRLMGAGARLVDLTAVETPAFADEVRLLQDTAYQLFWSVRALRNGISHALTLVGLALVLSRLQPLLPLALALAALPHAWAEGRAARVTYQAMADRSRAAREMDEAARVVTEPAAAKEVRLFGLGAFFLRRFRERSVEALGEIDRARLAQLRLSLACGLLYVVVLGTGFWYVATRAGGGRLTLGDVALYLAAMTQAQSRLTFLAQVYGFMRQALLGLRRLFSFLDGAGPRVALAERGRPAPVGPLGMALAHVAFSYGSEGAPVLEDVSAHLMPSGVTALVGANGAGKSTLVKLLTRMHDPAAGVITLDGAALADYDLISWRRRIAAAHQDFARFALTLRENIAVGGVTPEDSGAAVERAAGWAGADEIAAHLPHGYETRLTRRFEGGVDLSGGEWQKVALARAFVRNAGLVLLDEPTAALDADAEERLVARLRALMVGRTALLISHRFSTVRLADRILVLNGGRIVEEGTHADLLAANGRYAAWYEMQAGRYRDGAPSAEDAQATPT